MLSHLRFHRRAPSNPTSPLPEHAPAWDAVAQREHPQPPRDVSPRPDARPRSPNSSQKPPTLPPITRVASTGSDHFFTPLDDAAPSPQESRQPPPARAGYDEENKASFIGGVALQNYRKAAQAPPRLDTGATMAGQLPENQLSRAKPAPPPINTGVAPRPAVQGNRQTKASWFSTPTDLQGPGGNSKRPAGPRVTNDPALGPASEPQKGRKGLPFLKNPMSSLLMRRKAAQTTVENQPPAPSYDPRIKGTRVHDFSAPRPKKTVSGDAVSTTKQETTPTAARTVDSGEAPAPSFGEGIAASPVEPAQNDALRHGENGDAQLGPQGRRPSSSTVLPDRSPSLAPPNDASSLHTSSSAASRKTHIAPLPPASASVRTIASRQLSKADSVASAVPRHMKSTSSRFSFDMIGAAEQERLLEERHRQREQEKKTSDDPADARFDDFDDDFDYDAMMDDDGLEERIPGVNADYEYEEDLDADLDPDNDQENFAGFVFQRSGPVSSLASPHTPGMLATPRDATGHHPHVPFTHDLAYQAALAEAAQMAAASGKFVRSSSPEVLAGLDTPQDDLADYEDDETNGYDNFDDFDFDDEAIIAEANASALANDSDGFYGQEFGFYSAPISHQPHNNHHQPSATTSSSSGVLTTENLFHADINRSASGRVRSEYSNRNSVMSFTLPPAIGSGGSGGERNSASFSPGLAQLALLPADDADGMSLSALMKLRSRAWGGSQASLRALPLPGLPPLDAGGSPYGTVPAHLAGHAAEEGGGGGGGGGSSAGNGNGRGSGAGSPAMGVLPPRPGSAGAVVNGNGATQGVGVVSPLPQRPHSLFLPLPAQAPLPVPTPGGQQMMGLGGSACSPVLEGEEAEPEGAAAAAAVADGFALAPALPLRARSPAQNILDGGGENSTLPSRRPGMGHRHKGSADSISYRKDEEGGGSKFKVHNHQPPSNEETGTKEREAMFLGFQSFPFIGGATRCRGCDFPRPPYTGGYASVRSTLGTMLSNAKYIGCGVCAILSEGILKFLEDESCEVKREDVDELRVDFNLAASRRTTPWLSENLPDLAVGKEVPATTSSEESLSWAVQQLEHCKQNHTACNSFPPAPLPSRVLDVFAGGASGVRLYVSQGETSPYVALSHCWGHRPFLRTLSGSLDDHKTEIAWARLPQTFQDAVGFARRLGIRYLWIDSLCIIQDDQNDWRYEAARMASVYQNAVLVISAATSENAYGGLYAELPGKHRTYTVNFSPGQGESDASSDHSLSQNTPQADQVQQPQTETIHVRLSLSHPHRLLSPYHAPTASSLPIFTRGWILQERFLSPRILHFGPEELSLECLESTACQCTPGTTTPLTTETNLAPHLRTCWRRLVEDYTHLRLTHDGDVFPAVSGLARQMGRVRREARYVAGLWADEGLLGGDLLWRVQLPPSSSTLSSLKGTDNTGEEGGGGVRWGPEEICRPRGWRAPSWSWAAVRAPVEFISGEEGVEAACEVVEVKCEPVGVDKMGELREGGSWLVLKGTLVPTALRFKEVKEGEERAPWNVADLDVLDGGYLKNLWVDDDCRGLVPADGGPPTVYVLLVGRKLPRKELLCLVLARVPEDGIPVAQGRGAEEDKHLYRRIGLLEVFGGPASAVEWGWMHNLLGKGGEAVVRII
ncbi:heterokaryon incompatibility protein-domain-containing protein [Parachaetomium inaequale]|uniref:Heterokaryon incompatibility protein-domain-containing protein n=1 Tax=Parachaetomium inaequale TaxID=2588326 RepID=A0AAN6P9Z3_9PEZI|nr:heterokaryon incompatibility protein-domain-containing protein [Parachaetomium inaequale]